MQKAPRGSVAACESLNRRIVYLAAGLTAFAVLVSFLGFVVGWFGRGVSQTDLLLPAIGLVPAVYMAMFFVIYSLYQCVTRLMNRPEHSARHMNEDYHRLHTAVASTAPAVEATR